MWPVHLLHPGRCFLQIAVNAAYIKRPHGTGAQNWLDQAAVVGAFKSGFGDSNDRDFPCKSLMKMCTQTGALPPIQPDIAINHQYIRHFGQCLYQCQQARQFAQIEGAWLVGRHLLNVHPLLGARGCR